MLMALHARQPVSVKVCGVIKTEAVMKLRHPGNSGYTVVYRKTGPMYNVFQHPTVTQVTELVTASPV